MDWNGLSLVNNFAAELGDTSPAFKSKVLGYINDGLKDINSSFNWPQMRRKGNVVLLTGQETHSLLHPIPAAPTVAQAAGGGLTAGSEYKFLVTFYEGEAEIESRSGLESAGVTPAGGNLSVDLSAIPVSTNPLVTARKIYVSKAGGYYFYHSTINDNTTVTANISSDPSGQVTVPSEGHISALDGDIFIEGSQSLCGVSIQDFTFKTVSSPSTGTPRLWSPINEEKVVVWPKPSADTIAAFWYFSKPARVFGTTSSIPQMPSFLFDDLRRYVLWRGYDYRDRAGKESKEITYRENLKLTFSRKGKVVKKSYTVRVTTPDSDGMV
jgi:hypothetical protein